MQKALSYFLLMGGHPLNITIGFLNAINIVYVTVAIDSKIHKINNINIC